MPEKKFKKGDTVRWSHAKNQIGLPALYGVVYKANLRTLQVIFMGSGRHEESQPTRRCETWRGGKYIPWDGPYTKEEINKIAKEEMPHSVGAGWKVKHTEHWDPTDFKK